MLTPVILTPGNKIRLKTITQSKIYQKKEDYAVQKVKSFCLLLNQAFAWTMDDVVMNGYWLDYFSMNERAWSLFLLGIVYELSSSFINAFTCGLTLSFMVELIGRIGSYWLLKHVASLSLCLFQFLSYQTDTLNTFIISMSQIPCFQTLFPLKFH